MIASRRIDRAERATTDDRNKSNIWTDRVVPTGSQRRIEQSFAQRILQRIGLWVGRGKDLDAEPDAIVNNYL